MDRLFDDYGAKANAEHDTIKASASEVLSLYGALRHFVETRLPDDPRVQPHVEAFLAACKCVDVILLAKRGAISRTQARSSLVAAVSEHMRLHLAAFGDRLVRPKHHWAFDVAQQVGDSDYVFDAFIVERLHLRVKGIADLVANTTAFERSVLSGVANEHIRRGQACQAGGGLLGAFAQHPQVPGVLVADRLELGGVRAAVGDYLFRSDIAGLVVACCLADGDLSLVVDVCQKVRDLSTHSSLWRKGGARQAWPLAEVSECVSWLDAGDDGVVVIQM